MFLADIVILKNTENQLSSLISAVYNNLAAISSSKLPFEGKNVLFVLILLLSMSILT
jgi:hypothetical protein